MIFLYTYEVASIGQKAEEVVPYKAKPTKSDNMIKPFVDHGIFIKCCICEFHEYKSFNVVPGIQYTGTIDKYTENTSVAECI